MTLNRYAKLRRHKRYLKQRHAKAHNRWSVHDDERLERKSAEEDANYPRYRYRRNRNSGYWYWENCYLSGCRKYAKSCTNRRIRAKYRDLVSRNTRAEYLEVVYAPRGSDYEKEYDYFWTIY